MVAAALTAVAVVRQLGAGGEGQPAARPVASPPAAPVTRALGAVRAVRGRPVALAWRVDAAAGEATVTLAVTRPDGSVVRVLLDGVRRATNRRLVWRGRLDLPPGAYRYVAWAECEGRGQRLALPGRLTVVEPPFPGRAAVARALDWAAGRAGTPGVAVVTSDGRLHTLRGDRQYLSYSLSKAMILVAFLRDHAAVSDDWRATLARMITCSDNAAADRAYAAVGGAARLNRLAREVGMRRFHVSGSWIGARVTPADQACFFYRLERLVPARHRGLARELLSGVTPRQRWGIPAAAGPLGWKVFFKGGWSLGNAYMTQAAWLERGRRRFALAILTEGNPTPSYGFGTLKGVTGLLLGQEPTAAYLADVLE